MRLKRFKTLVVALTIATTSIVNVPVINEVTIVQAADKLTAKQKKTYKKIVNNFVSEAKNHKYCDTDYMYFSLFDINNDGKKELLLADEGHAASSENHGYIYNKDGKKIKLYYKYGGKTYNTDTVSGRIGVYKKGVILCSGTGAIGGYTTYYKVNSKGKFYEAAHNDNSSFNEEGYQYDRYTVNGKECTAEEYAKKVKSFGKNVKVTYYKCTSKNIKKYLG